LVLGKRGILADDSSIEKNDKKGFEIISLPGTLEYHQTQWGRAFFDVVQQHAQGWCHDECGMHVHLSRAAMSPLQIGRALVFLNDPKNRDFVEHVAGREAGEYCAVAEKKLSDALPYHLRSKDRTIGEHVRRRWGASQVWGHDQDSADHDERYTALNLTNEATVEIRIFRSNCAELGFLKNIEFCHALFTWARMASNASLTRHGFVAFAQRERGRYPNLAQWLQRENYFSSRHTFPSNKPMKEVA
jgi:hypothetical protein